MPVSRSWRIVLMVLGAVVLLVVGAAVALPFLIDVERYRPWIAEQTREATGRSITLGAISFRLLPAPRYGHRGRRGLSWAPG